MTGNWEIPNIGAKNSTRFNGNLVYTINFASIILVNPTKFLWWNGVSNLPNINTLLSLNTARVVAEILFH